MLQHCLKGRKTTRLFLWKWFLFSSEDTGTLKRGGLANLWKEGVGGGGVNQKQYITVKGNVFSSIKE